MAIPKAVLTPYGRFASARLAAAHYGISYTTAWRQARHRLSGWRYAEPPPPLPVIVLASKPTRKLGPRKPKPE
jgi:hypothetical protein